MYAILGVTSSGGRWFKKGMNGFYGIGLGLRFQICSFILLSFPTWTRWLLVCLVVQGRHATLFPSWKVTLDGHPSETQSIWLQLRSGSHLAVVFISKIKIIIVI